MDLAVMLTDYGRELLLAAGAIVAVAVSVLALMRHHHRDEHGVRPPRNPPNYHHRQW